MSPDRPIDELTRDLAEPFGAAEVKWKPAAVSGNRAMAIAYVDARVIQDRLDEVLGVEGWQDEYECLSDGSVLCRLRLRLGGEWVTKMDVGGPSEQPDGGDRMKAAFSDALKRAAVKFGVGRYLYRLPSQWVDYDPHKKQFVRTPTLSAAALPGAKKEAAPPPKKEAAPAGKKASALPKDGRELKDRLMARDKELADAGRIQLGDLVGAVDDWGTQKGQGVNMEDWDPKLFPALSDFVNSFCLNHKPAKASKP